MVERMLVAGNSIIWAWGNTIVELVSDWGNCIDSCLPTSFGGPPWDGIYVWEGKINICDVGHYYEVDANGVWREPTEKEWDRIMKQKNPWSDQ